VSVTPDAPTEDRPVPVRAGEEIDAAALGAWLRENLPPGWRDAEPGGPEPPAPPTPPEIAQFPGGHSNLTYLVRWGGRELVLRRPPVGAAVASAHDMGREYRVLSRLHLCFPKAPRALAACAEAAVIGAPFYVMERVRGVVLRGPAPPAGVAAEPAAARRLSAQVVDGLVELHALDPAALRAAGLAELGHPEGYVARQVAGWSARWRAAVTDEVPEIDRAAAWLAAHMPSGSAGPGAAPVLLHNDYKYDNLVFAADLSRVVAVLDWEMATLGAPLMDLGTTLAYWVDVDDDPALRLLPSGPTAIPGGLGRAEVVERYAAASGRDVSQILFYYVFGLLKVAVIAQQIYYRFRQGSTRDPRFAALLDGVRLLGRTSARAIARGRIDRLSA
jgi:aminoglycoside phosphotransferase (APT) family kinase protein